MRDPHREVLKSEFTRVAQLFAERTKGRFDDLGVVEFSRVGAEESVAEIGAGTGNFLSLFEGSARMLIAVDLIPEMLHQANRSHPGLHLVVGEGERIPLRSRSVDLVTSAQAFHHIHQPLPVLREMLRVATDGGRVLIVDQVATERLEEIAALNRLEILRDPSHAVSRPLSAFRILVLRAGLEIVEERVVESRSRLSEWMWPGEFPEERIDRVREFIEVHGHLTGKGFERDGDDFTFTRRRMMLLARRPRELL